MPEYTALLFSPEALAILDRQVYDPAAKGRYELMSSSLIWRDEFPIPGSEPWNAIADRWVYRYLIGCRADLTLGTVRANLLPVWEQVVRFAPNWPGLREERRGPRAKRRLLAAMRGQDKCLEELERLLASDGATDGSQG